MYPPSLQVALTSSLLTHKCPIAGAYNSCPSSNAANSFFSSQREHLDAIPAGNSHDASTAVSLKSCPNAGATSVSLTTVSHTEHFSTTF